MTKPDLLMASPIIPMMVEQLAQRFTLHNLWEAKDQDALLVQLGSKARAMVLHGTNPKVVPITPQLMAKIPALEIVANFGVGYNVIDTTHAAKHGIVVTNTPDVLNAEVADVTVGLLIATLREFPQSERHLRAGKWEEKSYRLSPGSLQGRTVGILGLGRIGKAIGHRLEAFGVKIAYHGRSKQVDVKYTYYPKLLDMAKDVDVLVVIAPATVETRNIVNAEVLKALGPDGVLINMARGTLVDEPALIAALRDKTILAAGLDVYVDEPKVPAELIALDNAVLLPHIGSASEPTRRLMGQLTVDNLFAWLDDKPLPTPVPETPWTTSAQRLAARG
jgi:lactate dehydrogenase-like 2-hydroxyacid dehydrogenase